MNIYQESIPYVYIITHKTTKQFYIGSRSANVRLNLSPENDILIKYFTTGTLAKDIRSNPSSYDAKILFRYDDYDMVFWYEQVLIRENIKNDLCANKQYIDPDLHNKVWVNGSHSTETIEKIKASNVGKNVGKKHSAAALEKISKASKELIRTEEHCNAMAVGRTRGGLFSKGYQSLTEYFDHIRTMISNGDSVSHIVRTCKTKHSTVNKILANNYYGFLD